MPQRMTDRYRRGKTRVVRVSVPVFFTREEAAVALADLYAGKPVYRGQNKIQEGLSEVAQKRFDAIGDAGPDERELYLRQQRERVDEKLVQSYREVLSALDERMRAAFERNQTKPALFDENGLTRLMVPVEYSLDEAARALALHYGGVPRRPGRRTLEKGLHEAAYRRALGGAQRAPRDLVDWFREQLIEHGTFTDPDQLKASE